MELLKELRRDVDLPSDQPLPSWLEYMEGAASGESMTVVSWFDEAIELLEAYLDGRSEEVSDEAKQSYDRFMNELYNSAGVHERKQKD